MPTNDPVLEVLREMRGDLVLVTTELGRLVRQVEYTNHRLDEHGEHLREHGQLLREHGERLDRHERILERQDARLQSIDHRVESVERHAVASVAALEVLHAGVQAIVPALEQGRLRDDRLRTRVDECERRIDALEQDR